MKRIGLFCMAVVLALGTLGIGYAMWSDTVTIDGTVYTGTVEVEFSNQLSNDAPTGRDLSYGDPAAVGTWDIDDPEDPSTWDWDGAVNMPDYKEVASINCTIDGKTMYVEIQDGYPSYFGGIGFTVDNLGSVPVKVASINMTEIGGVALSPEKSLTTGTYYYVDHETKTVSETLNAAIHDYCIVITDITVGDQIGAAGWDDDELFGDIHIHVEQAAKENDDPNYPVGGYTFKIEIMCCNWNEL